MKLGLPVSTGVLAHRSLPPASVAASAGLGDSALHHTAHTYKTKVCTPDKSSGSSRSTVTATACALRGVTTTRLKLSQEGSEVSPNICVPKTSHLSLNVRGSIVLSSLKT
jgi:hypothetical protein